MQTPIVLIYKRMFTPELAQIEDSHESVLEKILSLSLNANWQVIGQRTIKSAITSMLSESNGEPPVLALDIELDENGQIIYSSPTAWDDWVQLPIRDGDLYVQMGKGRVRAPTVTIARNFNRVVFKKPRVSSGAIQDRDKGVCQYTGRKLSRSEGNLDHVQPLSRGGKTTFENLVWADREINSMKGDRTPEEAGLKLIKKPKTPPSVPISATIGEPRHPSWVPFLIKS